MQSSSQNALICTCSTGHMIESISTTSDTSDCNQARRNTLHIVFINICIRNILRVRKFWSQMSRMYWILDRQLEDVMFCRFRYRIQALSNVWASYYRTENCFTLYTSKVPSVECCSPTLLLAEDVLLRFYCAFDKPETELPHTIQFQFKRCATSRWRYPKVTLAETNCP